MIMFYGQVDETNVDEIKNNIMNDIKASNFIKKRINNDLLDFIVNSQKFFSNYLVLEGLKNFSFIVEKKIDFENSPFGNNDCIIRFVLAKRGAQTMSNKGYFDNSKTLASYKIDEFQEYFPKSNQVDVYVYSSDALSLYKSVIALDTALSLINTAAPKGLTPVDYFIFDADSGDDKILAKKFEIQFRSQLFLKKIIYNNSLVGDVEFIFNDEIYEVEK